METPIKTPANIICAMLFTITGLVLGYITLGFWAALIFTFGYLGGLALWIIMPVRITLRRILIPYILTLAFFILHKVEERERNFFPALTELTGTPAPDPGSLPAILLYGIASIWLLVPVLIWKQYAFGYYLAWTFFASMGISELAHFVFPLFRDQPYAYFPGMWSVIPLAPLAWWGMLSMSRNAVNSNK